MRKYTLLYAICMLFIVILIITAAQAEEVTLSGMEFHVSTPADASDDSSDVYARLLVIDPQGNKTGYDPSVGAEVSQIPKSGYLKERIGNIQTGEPGLEGYDVGFDDPIAGKYALEVIGDRTSLYNLSIYTSDISGKSLMVIFKGITAPGTIAIYDIIYDPAAGFIPKIDRVVTIEDLRNDINIAYALILIDNPDIKQSLLAKLENAKKEIGQGNIQAAKSILNAFINEVNAQKEKHIKENAAKILLEGAHYLIEHL